MSSFLRKAMWPAALVVSMFVLLGAIGTATAPSAHAADWDFCNQEGPFPALHGPGADDLNPPGPGFNWENNFLLEGMRYLIVLYVEDQEEGEDTGESIASIDDETGDADFVYWANGDGTDDDPIINDFLQSVPAVDILDGLDNWQYSNWDQGFLDDLEDDWGFSISSSECGDGTEDGLSFVVIECQRHGLFELTHYDDGSDGQGEVQSWTEEYICLDDPTDMTITATPTTVESHPAIGNVSHSLIVAKLTDSSGDFVGENYEVDWTTTGCRIDGLTEAEYEALYKALFAAFKSDIPATAAAINAFLNPATHGGGSGLSDDSLSFIHDGSPAPGFQAETRAAAILHCEGAAPGVVTVTAQVEDDQFGQRDDQDITATTTVTVVGPPAFISMAASPTELVCGEKSQILVTVTDALGQNVSDHTRVELITNYGGVLGGTGSSLGFPGVNPVNPLSSSAAETFGGVATGFLLTSTNHIGSYEVVAAAGGSNLGQYTVVVGRGLIEDAEEFLSDSEELSDSLSEIFGDHLSEFFPNFGEQSGGLEQFTFNGNTGIFSTPVVTSQVTVTCSEAKPPAVVAPNTGTGTISPPNTGDGGLATRSASTATLFVIAGAVVFALAGFAGFGFARR